MALKLITAPATEPVTRAEVEAQLQGELPGDQFALVDGYIAAVRQKAETVLRRAMVTQTHELILDAFPASSAGNTFAAVEIPLPALQSVTSVKYTDLNGVLQTLAAEDYVVDVEAVPGRVMPAYGKTWPSTLDFPSSVRIRFVAGYGDAIDVPQCVKNWILMNVAALYENRETVVIGTGGVINLSTMADSLLDPERWEVRL